MKFCLAFKAREKAPAAQIAAATAAEPAVQTDVEWSIRAARLIAGEAVSVRQGWYEEARRRGCREIAAATAPVNLGKWLAWVAEDIVAGKPSPEPQKRPRRTP